MTYSDVLVDVNSLVDADIWWNVHTKTWVTLLV